MNKGYLYTGTVDSDLAPNGQYQVWIVYRGHDQACFALAQHFRVDPSAVNIKAYRPDGAAKSKSKPVEVFMPGADGGTEQCWADTNGRDRCTEIARAGFHTCRIHTSFDAPAPFGTPEYERWIAGDLRQTRSAATKARAKGTTAKTAAKPANRRSGARRKPKSPPT